jgi:hypothetical protein
MTKFVEKQIKFLSWPFMDVLDIDWAFTNLEMKFSSSSSTHPDWWHETTAGGHVSDGACRNDPNDLTLQHDCTAHSVLFDPATNTVRPLTILTDTWCSSGQFSPDGTLIQTGGDLDGFKVVRWVPKAQISLGTHPSTLATLHSSSLNPIEWNGKYLWNSWLSHHHPLRQQELLWLYFTLQTTATSRAILTSSSIFQKSKQS